MKPKKLPMWLGGALPFCGSKGFVCAGRWCGPEWKHPVSMRLETIEFQLNMEFTRQPPKLKAFDGTQLYMSHHVTVILHLRFFRH